MCLDYGERMHHYGPWEYSTPYNGYVFHFKLEFWFDTLLYPWERTESTGVWNHKCDSQALDANLFAKIMTAAPRGLWVTVRGFVPG